MYPFPTTKIRVLCTSSAILLSFFAGPSYAAQFKVTKVYSGDTIRAEGCGTEISVRLVGIDAPEISEERLRPVQAHGLEAKNYLTGLVLNEEVEIEGFGHEGYDLMLGTVFHEGELINLKLVQEGLAETYRGEFPSGLDSKPFFDAEQDARAAKKGIWQREDSYVSPSTWRVQEKLKSGFALILYGLRMLKGESGTGP